MWPPDDDLTASWHRLAADPDTAGAFAELVLPALEAALARRFPRADPHARTDAAHCTVLALLRRPGAFDPTKGALRGFLVMSAGRDLSNILRADGKHHRGRIPWDGVELVHPAGNDEEDVLRLADVPAIQAVIESLMPAERAVFDLICAGERRTAAFADVLKIADRPVDEQAAEVKRAKDRILARLKRAGGGHE